MQLTIYIPDKNENSVPSKISCQDAGFETKTFRPKPKPCETKIQTRQRNPLCFVASSNSALVHGSARQLLGTIKQTQNRSRLLLARP